MVAKPKINYSQPISSADLDKLEELIRDLDETARADEMKGGADPLDYHAIELNYEHSKALLVAHIAKMRRRIE